MTKVAFLRALAVSASVLCYSSLNAVDKNSAQPSNGLPNISAQSPSTRFDIFADFLIWYATESGSDNWAQSFVTTDSVENIDIEDLSFEWKPGFRIGIDYTMNYDQWDTQLYYSWFRTKATDSASTDGDITSSFLGNFFMNNTDGAGFGPSYHRASIEWTILYNVIDWELGRNYRVSKALSLRPFIGLKGGWINQKIHSKWEDPLIVEPAGFNSATENLKNNFFGVGPSIGLNTKWKVGTANDHSFSLFGDFSGALMWGHWNFNDLYKTNVAEEVSVHFSNITSAAGVFRTFMGFAWDANFKEDFHFGMRFGYEIQIWLDQLQFYSFNRGRLNNELTLQGGTVDVHFSF